jgi:hypothetical protein
MVIFPLKMVIFPLNMVIFPLNMVIFHCYVSLPEGNKLELPDFFFGNVEGD